MQTRLSRVGLAWQCDAYGNLVTRHGGSRPGPGLALAAHMDHPGFDVVETNGLTSQARVLGGVPVRRLRGSGVRGVEAAGHSTCGVVVTVRAADGHSVRIRWEHAAAPRFAVLDLPDYEEEGSWILARALDDLVGCALVLATLEEAHRRNLDLRLYGVFARAEEVGFVGASLVEKERYLPRGTHVLSLEASRALPGGEVGRGPVLRVGDRTTVFSTSFEYAMRRTLEDQGVQFQRQLMSGGTCEATAYGLGYPVMGIAIPLLNYHNEGRRGVQAERVSVRDVEQAARLLRVLTSSWRERIEYPTALRRRIQSFVDKHAERLRRTAR